LRADHCLGCFEAVTSRRNMYMKPRFRARIYNRFLTRRACGVLRYRFRRPHIPQSRLLELRMSAHPYTAKCTPTQNPMTNRIRIHTCRRHDEVLSLCTHICQVTTALSPLCFCNVVLSCTYARGFVWMCQQRGNSDSLGTHSDGDR
jgi:hypothetical protein